MKNSIFSAYLRVALIVFTALFGASAAFAIVADPFKVFGFVDLNRRNFEPNTRYLKIEHLKTARFDGYIFGTSRANAYGPALAGRLTGQRFYNLNAPSSTPYDIYRQLEWLLKRGPVKQIILALDFDELDAPLERNPYDLVRQEHPAVSGTPKLLFWWKYLWVAPEHHAIAFYGNWLKRETWYTFDVATGQYHFPLFDRQLAEAPEAYVRAHFEAVATAPRHYRPNPQQMDYLRRTLDLARANRIEAIVVINPVNQRMFRNYDPAAFARWKNELLAMAASVWDFSGVNSVTTRDSLYYEVSHFTPAVGELVLLRIFAPHHPKLAAHPDFGRRLDAVALARRSAS